MPARKVTRKPQIIVILNRPCKRGSTVEFIALSPKAKSEGTFKKRVRGSVIDIDPEKPMGLVLKVMPDHRKDPASKFHNVAMWLSRADVLSIT
jgi:hypothetical protein